MRNIFPTAPARFHAARARRATRKPAREVTFSGFRTRTTSPIPRWNNTPPFARSRRPPARFDGIEPPKTIHAQKRDHPSVAPSSSSSSPARRIQSKSPPHLHVFVSLPVARHDVMALLFQSLGEVRADETARARDANFQFLFRPVRLRAVDASQFVSRGRHGSFGSLRARFGRRSRCVDGRRAAAEVVRSLGSVRALFQSSRALFSIPVPVLPHTRTLCVCMCIHTRTVENHDRPGGTRPRRFSSTRDGTGTPASFFSCVWDTILFTHTPSIDRAGHPERAGRFFTRLDSTRLDSARGVPLAHDGGGASKKLPTATGDTSRRGAGAGFTERTAIEGRRFARALDRSIDDESNRTERSFDPTRGKREEGNRTDKRTWRRHRARRWTTRDSARS